MIYILLPVYNRKEVTKKFIKALLSQNYKDYKLVLIDDGSTDGTDEMVLSMLPETIVLKGDGNLWWAGALQKGYEWLCSNNISDEDIILIINDDTEFESNFLQIAVNIMLENNNILLKSWCIDINNNLKGDGYIVADLKCMTFTPTDNPSEANCVSTRGLFLSKKDFIRIGGLRPDKLPHYLSDYELTIRAHKKGMNILCDDSLYLFYDHNNSGHHEINFKTINELFEKYFSYRNIRNPFHWINFIDLTCENDSARVVNKIKLTYRSTKYLMKLLITHIQGNINEKT